MCSKICMFVCMHLYAYIMCVYAYIYIAINMYICVHVFMKFKELLIKFRFRIYQFDSKSSNDIPILNSFSILKVNFPKISKEKKKKCISIQKKGKNLFNFEQHIITVVLDFGGEFFLSLPSENLQIFCLLQKWNSFVHSASFSPETKKKLLPENTLLWK